MALIKCKECGKEFSDMADACPNCGYNPARAKEKEMGLKPKAERKNKTVALLLTFFLWWVGGEFFYLGNLGMGITTLIVGCLTLLIGLFPAFLFVWAICAIVRFIRIACMSEEKFDQTYNSVKNEEK